MFDSETAVSILAIQQLVAEWGYDLDVNDCAGVAQLCTAQCDYFVGGTNHKGRDRIDAFYAARNERVRTQQKDGIRTQRHTISNFRTAFAGKDAAKVEFLLVNYSGEGKPPILHTAPTIIAECTFQVVREDDGEWRIALFDSTPLFVGNDPFLNAAVVKK
jgi:uncharacterized protein (TIGR02246 family)